MKNQPRSSQARLASAGKQGSVFACSGALLASLLGVSACTDLTFDNGRRISDNHIMSGAPDDVAEELNQIGASVVSRDEFLTPLETAIQSRIGFRFDAIDSASGRARGRVQRVTGSGQLD